MKKISVIVPVYNVEKYIEKCLDSLKNQTMKDIEFIIVNDGSTDNSQRIIDKYVKNDKRFKSIIKENGGQGSARNFGLENANGEYIGYVDSDDYIEKNMYEKMYLEAKKNNSDIVLCGNYVVDENGKILREEKLNSSGQIDKNKNKILFDKMAVWNKIYRRTFLNSLNIKFREKKWYEDFDFSMKVLLSTNSIYVIDECLYYYFQRSGSTMNNNNFKRNLEIIDAFEEILLFMKNKSIYDKYFSEIEYVALLHIYLATNVRIICSKVNRREQIKCVKIKSNYFYGLFSNFKNNIYIKSDLSLKKKIVMHLLNLKMYSLIKFMFIIKK